MYLSLNEQEFGTTPVFYTGVVLSQTEQPVIYEANTGVYQILYLDPGRPS